MADGLITYEEAIGGTAPAAAPVAAAPAPDAASVAQPDDSSHLYMTVHGDEPRTDPAPPKVISYEDATAGDTPHPGGALSNSAGDGYFSGAAKGLGTAAIKGLSNSVGFAGGLMDLGDYLMARGESKITGKPLEEVMKSQQARRDAANAARGQVLTAIDPRNVLPSGSDISNPILAKTGEYVPTSEPGRMAQAGAETVFSGLGPGAGSIAGATGKQALLSIAKMAPGNIVAGSVGQGVTDLTGDPLLGLGAGIAATVTAHGGATVAKKVGVPAILGIPGIDDVPVIGPRVAAARDNAAAGRIVEQATDPAALKTWAAQPAATPDVPNSPQTTAGAVGNDRGLFQAEKDARNANNLPFNAADRAQSNAQLAAIQGAQPTGDVFAPGQLIRQRMDAIDAAAQAAEDRLTAAHQAAADRLNAAHQDAAINRANATQGFADQANAGLAARSDARGQAALDEAAQAEAARAAEHDRLVQTFADAQTGAQRAAETAAAPLGERANAEDLGSTLRTATEEVRSGAKALHKSLYDAVDPDETLALVASPVRGTATSIVDRVHADGSSLDPIEADLFRRATTLPDVMSYRALHTLDKDVGAAMSKERRTSGETPALARLTQLKGAIKSAISNAVDNQVAHEARLVAAGRMAPEDTIEARLTQNLQGDVAQFHAERNARAASGTESNGADLRAGSASAARVSRTTGQSAGGPGGNASTQGIPPEPLQPNADPAVAERLRAANSAYANYSQIYKNPIVGPGLKTTGYSGQYQVGDAAFMNRAIVPGDRGFEVANAHLTAAGHDPRAVFAMQEAALNPLRKSVQSLGTVHPNALARWKESYGPALRALDDVAPGFSDRFDTAANATQALLDLGAAQKQALADFQKQAAGQAMVENVSRRQALGDANAADRATVKSLLAERASDDQAINAASKGDAQGAISASKTATQNGVASIRQRVADANASPAGKFLAQGADKIAPAEVENAVGNLLKTGTAGATRMRGLVQSVSSDPDALAGLRKAGVDWIVRTHQNADGSLSGAKFIDFIRDNRDVLKELYPPNQVSMFAAVARDSEANARWRTATAIKGGSDTAKNVKPMIESAVEEGKRHISIMSAATAGFLAGGPKGAAGGAGLYLLNSLRSAGLRKIEDVYRDALLNPEMAKLLISKMPEAPEGGKLRQLSGLVRRTAIVAPMLVSGSASRPQR